MREYELIDTTDNDCHDTGDRAELLEMARQLNADDAAFNATAAPADRVKSNRWVVRSEGFAAANFKG